MMHPLHFDDLRRSGLSDETIKLAGFETVRPNQINKELGFNIPNLTSMYQIPYGEGFSRFRAFYDDELKKPTKGLAKYLQRRGTGNHLYIPFNINRDKLQDADTPIYFTEGEKKSLKACQEGLLCIGLSGLWNWKEKDKGLIPDFDKINFKNRKVFIVPDNDYKLPNIHGYKKNLEQAVHELAFELIKHGSQVFIVELPDGAEKGIDDYLITHSIDELLALPAKPVRKVTIEEAVAEATLDKLSDVLKRISKVPSQAKQEVYLGELAKRLKVSRTALKMDLLNHFGAKTETRKEGNNGLPMIGLFPELVDLVEVDGKVAFLRKDTSGPRIDTVIDIDGVQYIPPPKEQLPFLLPRAEHCLRYCQAEDKSLFDDLLSYLRRFSYLPDDQWIIIGLYVLASYLQDHRDIHYQAMLLFSAVPERGKSRTGKAIVYVAYRGIHMVDMRETNIFRCSGNLGATLFFDIMDLWKKAERSGSEDVLLLRHEKGAKVPRVLYPEKGAFKDTVFYPVYGPTIMASNAEVHRILGSRCLTFSMPNVPGNYEDATPELALNIKERLVAWRGKMMDKPLPDMQLIDGISGRLWDITKPLFQICSVICPQRHEALVKAVKAIAGERIQDKKESFDGRLIQVIYELTQGDADHFDIPTADVATRFNELWNSDKPKSKEWTGRRLKALGVPTDTKSGKSMIRLNRETLTTLLIQYGFISHGDEKASETSRTSEDIDNTSALQFEVPVSAKNQPQEHQKTSIDNTLVYSDGFEEQEVSDVIPGVFTKEVEKKKPEGYTHMNAEIVIQRLRSIGYRIRTDGKDILLNADREPPNAAMVIYLIKELRKCKTEVMNILQMGSSINPTEKTQQQANVNASWPLEIQSLINWFLELEPPAETFYLEPHMRVIDPKKFFATLRREIETGPFGPRARMGTLQADLRKLKVYLN